MRIFGKFSSYIMREYHFTGKVQICVGLLFKI